jgi:hypothetical protein
MTRIQRKPKQERKINNMKTNIISKLLLSLSLVFVLGSAITQVRGQEINTTSPAASIHSTGDVIRGKTGSFVVNMQNVSPFAAPTYVNVSVGGTAIPGVDYVTVVSPTLVGASGYGVISIKTLPDRRASANQKAYSVVVKVLPGPGYTVSAAAAAPSSATMWIKPCSSSAANCQ